MSKHGIKINNEQILQDKYRVVTHIASGGMSEVYLVEDIHDSQQQWAMKIVNKESKLSKKIVDETKILSELDHPNISKMIDFFTSEKYIFLVMEYAEGTVLSEFLLEKQFDLPINKVIEIGIQISDILHYLHTRSIPIIYRDIKPGNIILSNNGSIKLIDFGISRKYQDDKMKDTLKIGTVGFAAPEQFEQKQSDFRTDLFSLGALLYFILSKGKYVYVAQKPISYFVDDIPRKLEKCINQLVELKPEKRIQNAQEVKVLLTSSLEEKQVKKSRFARNMVVIALFIVIFITVFFVLK
ncbi:serine/threonine protein kinase [Ornithinibacillus massiliensis]|uniref:non-specific serine/threonine protein kinase n=1 Tax=Ornithinibacillus massiliensis TaxID=1944633 RepID=A0ABS5MDF8_9BACI|nr:serine/threonine-protein kinase [Ornithinibacillus massiliensis]MBS3680351.1 serine/threonine protein kinase [Ornithinibacillus massiliensis]